MGNETENEIKGPLTDMRIFLNDPWKYLEEPIRIYQQAELLKGKEFDRKEVRTKIAPFVSSLINTRNPQVVPDSYKEIVIMVFSWLLMALKYFRIHYQIYYHSR